MANLTKLILLTNLTLFALSYGAVEFPIAKIAKKPFINATDLYYPPWDYDDVMDVNLLYAMTDSFLDPILQVMDQPYDGRGDGSTWKYIYNYIYGIDVDYGIGLISQLTSITDNGSSQAYRNQDGVNKILAKLSASTEKVTLSATGSARDFAAAFLRDSTLFRQKVDRIYFSCGKDGDIRSDPNMGSDPNSIKILVTNNVPLYFSFSNGTTANYSNSQWSLNLAPYLVITDTINDSMLSTALYWSYWTSMDGGYRMKHNLLERPAVPVGITEAIVKAHPVAFFDEPRDEMSISGVTIDQEIRNVNATKAMWSPINFYHAAGLNIFYGGNRILLDYADSVPGFIKMYSFRPFRAVFDNGFNMSLQAASDSTANVWLYKCNVTETIYQTVMNSVYREFIRRYGRAPDNSINESTWSDTDTKGIALDVFPNPFNSIVSISFNLTVPTDVRISMHDTNGRLIEKIQDQRLSAGNHVRSWNCSERPSGIYMITVKAGNKAYAKGIVLMK